MGFIFLKKRFGKIIEIREETGCALGQDRDEEALTGLMVVGVPRTSLEVGSSGLPGPPGEAVSERAASQVCRHLALNACFDPNYLGTLDRCCPIPVPHTAHLNLNQLKVNKMETCQVLSGQSG